MGKSTVRSNGVGGCGDEAEAALNVTVAFQDALTRHWAWELWSRVGRLTGDGGICRKSWSIPDLGEPEAFAEAVQAAARADVLVIAVRDTEEVPLVLRMWIDAWLSRREGRPGALVALLGVPGQPNAQEGRAHRLLENVARKAGLEYLPRERKLPDKPSASAHRSKTSRKRAVALTV